MNLAAGGRPRRRREAVTAGVCARRHSRRRRGELLTLRPVTRPRQATRTRAAPSFHGLNSEPRRTHLLEASETFRLQEEEGKGHQHEQAEVGEEGGEVPQTCGATQDDR